MMKLFTSVEEILNRAVCDKSIAEDVDQIPPAQIMEIPVLPPEEEADDNNNDGIKDKNDNEALERVSFKISRAKFRETSEYSSFLPCRLNDVRSTFFPPQSIVGSKAPGPLARETEVRKEVTPSTFKDMIKATSEAKILDTTHQLAIHGSLRTRKDFIKSTRIKELRKICPSIKSLTLQNLNLHARPKNRRMRLADFPANIEVLSLRDSSFEPKTFFSKMSVKKMEKLRVLDVGRTIYVGKGVYDPEAAAWPRIESVRELYLEGSPQLGSALFLEKLLAKYPNLEVLDLEGTELRDDDLVTIARLVPRLRELHLGFTNLGDTAVFQLVKSGLRFEFLEKLCLSETKIRDSGFESIVRWCRALRCITVKRAFVGAEALAAALKIAPDLKVKRVEMSTIFVLFRDQGCNHFELNHNPRE